MQVFQPGTALIFWAAPIVANELFIFSSIFTHLKSSRATRFVDCSWEWLGWSEQGIEIILTGKGIAGDVFKWAIFWIVQYSPRKERFRFFSADKQFLQMYVESISTLHSIDNKSARALKEKPLWPSKRFLFLFFVCLFVIYLFEQVEVLAAIQLM